MHASRSASPRETCWIGVIAAAGGLYLTLVGLGLLPVPGGPRNLHAPLWIVLLVGLLFLLAGAAMLLQVIGRADAGGSLPADAPFWIRVVQYLIGVAMFLFFAVLGTWVALGGDARHFSGGVPFLHGTTNVAIARGLFGLGAAVVWLATIAFAVSGARKLLRARN